MFVENLEDLPEAMRGQFEEVEIDGKKGYQDKDSIELRSHLYNVKGENKTLKEKQAESAEQLSQYEEQQAQKIKEARDAALQEAESKGDTKRIREEYEQQMEDLKKRVADETRAEVMGEVSQERAKEKADNIRSQIATAEAVDADSAQAVEQLLASRVKVDPETNKEVYYDAKGGALSVDRKGFLQELKKEAMFKRLLKANIATSGGGQAKGSGSGGATVKEATRSEFEAWTPQQKSQFSKDGGKIV